MPFLKESLSSDSNYVRANAAMALGETHDVSATPELIRMLKVEKDSAVIEQTALGLAGVGAHEAVPGGEAGRCELGVRGYTH